MRLHDLMHEELADVRADAAVITARAVAARRHRRLTWGASGVAASVVLAVGGWALAGHEPGERAVDPAGAGTTVPASARVVAGALATAVGDGSLGDLGSPTSWAGIDASPSGYAAAASWEGAGNSGTSMMGLYLFRPDAAARALLGLSGPATPATPATPDLSRLCSQVTAPATCHHTDLPDGDSVLTIDVTATGNDSSSIEGPTEMAVLSSPRRDIVVFAMAQAASAQASWSPPPADRLKALVEQPWWGWDLPGRFAQAGSALPHYTQHRLSPDDLGGTTSSSTGSASGVPAPTAGDSAPASGNTGTFSGSASPAAKQTRCIADYRCTTATAPSVSPSTAKAQG